MLCHICISGVLLLLSATILSATPQPDNPDSSDLRDDVILFIGHFNFDPFPDTITGRKDNQLQYLPHTIWWGNPDLTDSADTANPIIRSTELQYPGWLGLGGTVAFQRFNPDSLDDLVIHIWGAVGDSASPRDTLRSVVLFGQHLLNEIPVVDIGTVSEFQDSPFFAMDLRMGIDLVDPAIRDLSEIASYELKPVDIDVTPPDTTTRPAPPVATVTGSGRVHIYPNPAAISAQVEGVSVPAGEYRVEVVAVNGQTHLRQEITVDDSGNLFRTLDLQHMPSGYYIVRLEKGGKVTGAYPIIITR